MTDLGRLFEGVLERTDDGWQIVGPDGDAFDIDEVLDEYEGREVRFTLADLQRLDAFVQGETDG